MVVCPESCPRSQSCALRLRPGKGLRCGRGLFHMAMFAWAEVTLSPRWKEPLLEKRVGAALDWLRGQGVREAVLPDAWQDLARSRHIAPISRERALTNEEAAERHELRQAYLQAFRSQFRGQLDQTVVEYPDGSRVALRDVNRKKK